jgi:PIN domain nuclease of toxin-antitoxin system
VGGSRRLRLLLDTHALIWLFEGNPRLPRPVLQRIDAPDSEVHVSAVSALEVTTKFRIGKLPHMADLANNFEALMLEYGFRDLPITMAHARTAGLLEAPHRDPFDRLLIAQALAESLTLVSNEVLFDAFGVSRLW